MALVLADRVLETTTTTGSGTITLAGAEPGYQSFAVVGNGNETYYTIAGDTEWEVGIGTYTSSGTTLSRDTVLSSSDSGNKVTFSAGVKKVFVTYPSEKSVDRDVSGNITATSGRITNVAEPITGSDAATKLYVDSLVAAGITYHAPVKYEVPNTTGNLTATYNNGTAGVSATLTNAGTLVAFVPDGVTASISDRILVYSQTNQFENGVYVVSTVGNGSTAWVLTRATDADTYGLKSPNSLGSGDAFYVTSGNTGAGETYVCNTSGVISFGSTAITFAQISSAQVYQAGNGISLTNTVISLATPVSVANGGTGQSAAPSNGQLLIGNGVSFVLSTLTAGSGVSITNSAGSITLSATNSGAVTSVTATGPLASSGGATPDISIANSTGTGSVVLDQGATISSATITAAASASITTITGTSANITTVSGTTARFSSAAITQLSGTSAGITTVSGTTTTFSSGTITQFGATSATIASVSGTNVTYSNGNLTSATVTTVSGTNLSYGSATITTGNLAFTGTAQRITGDFTNATVSNRLLFQSSTSNGETSVGAIPNGTSNISRFVVYSNSDPNNSSIGQILFPGLSEFSIRSGLTGSGSFLPITFYTGGSERVRIDTSGNVGIKKSPSTALDVSGTITGTAGSFTDASITSATITNLASTSANITTLTGTTFGTTATTQLRGASAQITTLTSTSANITTITGTTLGAFTSGTITNLNSTSANITTLTGTTFGTTATTQIRANSLAVSATGARWDANGDIYAVRSGGTTGVVFLNSAGTRYLFWDNSQYYLNGANLSINGALAVTANGGSYGISITGNAATVTNGFYTTGGTMTGQITTRETTGATPIVSGSGSNSLQVMGNPSNGAFLSFHRAGAYAINMGLDTSNVLLCGGWSDGGNYRWQVDSSGNFTARGNVTAYSDERVKKNWRPVNENLIEKIVEVKSGVYDRTDAELTQVGVSAQSLREVLPEAVFESNDGHLSVAYGNAALITVIELAKEVIKLKAEIEALKAAK